MLTKTMNVSFVKAEFKAQPLQKTAQVILIKWPEVVFIPPLYATVYHIFAR